MSPGQFVPGDTEALLFHWSQRYCWLQFHYELPQRIIVHPSPTAALYNEQYQWMSAFTATFVNTSSGYTSSLWEFRQDGGTSTDNDPNHLYLMMVFMQYSLLLPIILMC